jgi:hypothetical protein
MIIAGGKQLYFLPGKHLNNGRSQYRLGQKELPRLFSI